MFNDEYSHEAAGGTTWPLELDQEISGRAATLNKNKNNYALTFEKWKYAMDACDDFSHGEETTRIESVGDEMFEFRSTFTSTPAKRKRKACEREPSDSSMGEESLWLAQNASIKEDEETSELRDSEDDDDIKNGDKLEGNSSSSCDFSFFKDKAFSLMFEDGSSHHCKNIVVGLCRRVEELFNVQKVTDLVVNNC